MVLMDVIYNQKWKEVYSLAKKNRYLLIFAVLACVINLIYLLLYGDTKFIVSSLCWVFVVGAVMTFMMIGRDTKFLRNIAVLLQFNIFLQFIIWLVGLGRYHSHDTYRLMGTFNDPNQFAFYIFVAMLLIYIINQLRKKSNTIVDWLAWLSGVVLIAVSSSTGVLIGLVTAVALLAIMFIYRALKKTSRKIKAVVVASIAIALIGGLASVVALRNANVNLPIVDRIYNKIVKKDGRNILEDRGLDTIVHYPKYLLYGAGEGDYSRFPKQKNGGNEIHSSLIALVFYYGIIPVAFLLKWLYDVTKKASWLIKITFLAILVESFTLINYRQPLVWILLILPLIYSNHARKQSARLSK
jgi:hypothetical protein